MEKITKDTCLEYLFFTKFMEAMFCAQKAQLSGKTSSQ